MGLSAGKAGAQIEMAGTRVAAVFLRLPFSWRGAGAVLIAVLLARWTWMFFAPQAPAVLPAQSGSSAAAAGLFGMATAVSTAEGAPTGDVSGLRLVGVFSGKRGFAILRLDERRQIGVALGEEVLPGVKLVAVAADHVLLERNGTQQRVNLESRPAAKVDNAARAEPPVPVPVAPAAADAAADPDKAMQEALKMMAAAAKATAKDKQ